MAVRNLNWYNLQSSRKYPLDDAATGIDDSGQLLPTDILLDCHLRFPAAVSDVAYLSGVNVSSHLVSLLFQAVTDDGAFVPLCAVTLPQPVVESRHYPVTPLQPGVGGLVVFGGGVREPYVGRFSSPAQSSLLPRCCRAYKPLPVQAVKKVGVADELTGLVYLLAGVDLELIPQAVQIDGITRDAYVLQLTRAAGRNVLKEYIGPCDRRPESRNCPKDGIESINNVAPDCNGNLQLRFDNFVLGPYAECAGQAAGVTLDHDINLAQVCAPRTPDRFEGQVDYCGSTDSLGDTSVSSVSLSDPPVTPVAPPSSSTAEAPCLDVPYSDVFQSLDAWTVESGSFALVDDTNPAPLCKPAGTGYSLAATNASRTNLAVLSALCTTAGSLNKRYTVDLRATSPVMGYRAGLVLHHRTGRLSDSGFREYFVVAVTGAGTVQILRYTGSELVVEHSVACEQAIQPDHWYRLAVEAFLVDAAGPPLLRATVSGLTAPAWPTITLATSVALFGDGSGQPGLWADFATAHFSCFTMEDY